MSRDSIPPEFTEDGATQRPLIPQF